MTSEIAEAAFRRWWMLVLPLVLVPIAVVILTRTTGAYRSVATVWVANPAGVTDGGVGSANPYLTAAQNQAQTLNDLLSTQAFRIEAAKAAGLLPGDPDPVVASRVAADLAVRVGATGTNVLKISGDGATAENARRLVAGVIAAYQERITIELQRNSDAAQQYYTEQLAVAQRELDSRRAKLTAYLAEHPRAAIPGDPQSLDLDYQTLLTQVDAQSKTVDGLRQSLQTVELKQAGASSVYTASFAVQDPPSAPLSPVPPSSSRKYGVPTAGLALGGLLGFAAIYATARTDRTVRTVKQLEGLAVPVLGSVPEVSPHRSLLPRQLLAAMGLARDREFARRAAASILAPLPHSTRERHA